MTDRKKAWITPELIVLVRNKPEEQVLTSCKTNGQTSSVSTFQTGCKDEFGCPDCSEPGTS
jgi:hypothetical protein